MITSWFGPLMIEGRTNPLLPDWVLMNKESSPSSLLPDWLMIKELTPTKTYDMVDDPATDGIVSWRPDGRSFVVWDVRRLSRDLLPKYFFNCNQITTFALHLILCGFKYRVLNPDHIEFAKEGFVRGKRHLLNIEPNLEKLKKRGETTDQEEVKEEIKEETKNGIKVEIKQVKEEVEIKEVIDLTSSSLQKYKKRRIDGLSACSSSSNL